MSSVAIKPRLQTKYKETIVPTLMEELSLGNINSVPKLEKIVLNMGVGEAVQNKKAIEDAVYTLTNITGQKPVITKARKAISNFRLRDGVSVGVKVTLRGAKMYEFLDRLISVYLPRMKDFRGVSSKSFDGTGNYNLGFSENLMFPEINRDKIGNIQGLELTICTTASENEPARLLLDKMGMPFRK